MLNFKAEQPITILLNFRFYISALIDATVKVYWPDDASSACVNSQYELLDLDCNDEASTVYV